MLQGFWSKKCKTKNLSAFWVKLGPKMRFVVAAINFLGTRSKIARNRAKTGKNPMFDSRGWGFELLLKKCWILLRIPRPLGQYFLTRGVTASFGCDVDRGVEARRKSLGMVKRIQNLRKDMGLDSSKTRSNPICLTIMIWSNLLAVAGFRKLTSKQRPQAVSLSLESIWKMHLCWRWDDFNIL